MRVILVLCVVILQACAQAPQQTSSTATPPRVIYQSNSNSKQQLDQQVHHVVLVWLTDEYKDRLPTLLKASKALANIPGIIHLKASTAIQSDRPIVDDSFDLGVWMTFKSTADMQQYLQHKKHQDFLKKHIHGKVHRVKAYDF